jgi:hypothetical protein
LSAIACGLCHESRNLEAEEYPVLRLQTFALVAAAVVAAWLLFRVIKKIVIAVIVIVLVGALALFVYIKFF